MAKIESKKEFSGKSASECYEACLSLVNDFGYTLFKKRPIANLIICNGQVDGQKMDVSMVVPMTSPTSISVNLSAEDVSEDVLNQEAERVLNIISEKLQ